MKKRFKSERDRWGPNGEKINSPEHLAVIRETLEKQGPIIVEHWFYRGGSAPERRVFEDIDEFEQWLNEECSAGDAVDVWSFSHACKWEGRLAGGKCPDENGLVPAGGAY